MIQNQGQAKFLKRLVLYSYPFVFLFLYFMMPKDMAFSAYVANFTFGALLFGFLAFRFHLLDKVEERYIHALSTKDKQQALYFGRQYYSMKRGGVFLGADGSKCSIYDEQAIANEINVYCN